MLLLFLSDFLILAMVFSSQVSYLHDLYLPTVLATPPSLSLLPMCVCCVTNLNKTRDVSTFFLHLNEL